MGAAGRYEKPEGACSSKRAATSQRTPAAAVGGVGYRSPWADTWDGPRLLPAQPIERTTAPLTTCLLFIKDYKSHGSEHSSKEYKWSESPSLLLPQLLRIRSLCILLILDTQTVPQVAFLHSTICHGHPSTSIHSDLPQNFFFFLTRLRV